MHRENIYNIIKFIILAKVILILLFLGSCTSVDYIILNDNKIDSKSDIGIITFNIKAIYEKEELEIDDFLGEYSFFSEKKRMASARSKNFYEVLRIEKSDFLKTIKSYPESEDLYE